MIDAKRISGGGGTEVTGQGDFNQHFPSPRFKRFRLIARGRRQGENLSRAKGYEFCAHRHLKIGDEKSVCELPEAETKAETEIEQETMKPGEMQE